MATPIPIFSPDQIGPISIGSALPCLPAMIFEMAKAQKQFAHFEPFRAYHRVWSRYKVSNIRRKDNGAGFRVPPCRGRDDHR